MIGIDEVGRGCWAGPLLVVAARTRINNCLPNGLTDSKVLNRTTREKFAKLLLDYCDFGEGWVSALEIDQMGLTQAMRLGVSRALATIDAQYSEKLIMDGNVNYCAAEYTNVRCVVRADSLLPIVSAASIWAKVTRDRYMIHQAKQFPGYGFDSHVGYGTKQHSQALQQQGITPLHRLSYKPVRRIYESR